MRPSDLATRPVAELIPYAANSRTHSDAQISQIAASITEFGFTNPVLIDGEGGIIAGHGRVLAAKALGLASVPVLVLDHLTAAQRRAYVIADNRIALSGGWDEDILRAEIEALGEGFDLDLLGFDGDELDALLNPPTKGEVDPDDVPETPAVPVTRAGDVWLMGRHRLMCGSSTDRAAVDRLLNGQKAALCLTDPPYGLGAGKKSGKNAYVEYDDTRDNLVDLAKAWLPIARDVAKVVVFSPGVTNQWLYPEPSWVICWYYGGGQLRSPWGFNCWQPFLCYGKEPGLAAGRGARPDAVDMNTPANAADIDHPCPKPVKLWEWFIDRLVFSKDAMIFEPFSGSGTGFIAAETRGIAVSGMELSPAYVDVAARRWEAFTDRAATLEATGQTFREVSDERRLAAQAA